MRVLDVSPAVDTTEIAVGSHIQSVSGRALCIACSPNGQRVYLGGHSGVWRSFDGGLTWEHPEWKQPPPGQTAVSGALIVPNVYSLLVSPTNPDVVLAATGRDARRPDQSGIYRSIDAAATWTRVHRFARDDLVGLVGSLAVAPDRPTLMFAGGSLAVGVSNDAGATWSERTPQTRADQRVRYVVVGPQQGGERRVYAVGSRVWHSRDGGETWHEDSSGPSVGAVADWVGESSRAVAIHPTDPRVIYIRRVQAGNEELWRGQFSGSPEARGVWRQVVQPPMGYPGTTASGNSYVVMHAAADGQLLMFVSDRRTSHMAVGEPARQRDWIRIDTGLHVDPHGIAMTPDFRRGKAGSRGRIYLTNDGGAYVSSDGARTWKQGKGLSTLGLVNAAVVPRKDGKSAICIQTGDNSGFYTRDGSSWRTQHYLGGDNDCTFADPRQPSRLIVFAPRAGPPDQRRRIFLYVNPDGDVPDATLGTKQSGDIPGPPGENPGDPAPWNAVSGFYNRGYRPLVLTLPRESPRPDGDFVTIYLAPTAAKLMRTTAMSQINSPRDWVTNATGEGPGIKAFQVGPDLPDRAVDVVQASGGHERPTFYVSDSNASGRLWKWAAGMSSWRRIDGSSGAPSLVRRFFVDPYRPEVLYALDAEHVRRSNDGGSSWVVDRPLERALTEGGAFPFDIPWDATADQALLRDMAFDPHHGGSRFATGPAGVFFTLDGTNWSHLLLSSAIAARPVNLTYLPGGTPCDRALYVSTSNRGLLRIHPLPPEWDAPMGSVEQATGRITLLRAHDVGTGFGPANDPLEAEVVVMLDSEPGKAFGFQLRTDAHEQAARGELEVLRGAFNRGRRVRIEYVRTGCRVGRIIRVIETL